MRDQKESYSFDELHLKYLIDQIDVDSVDLRDIGNTKYENIRTVNSRGGYTSTHCYKINSWLYHKPGELYKI